jgi:transcriptional regulator with XRE-family HTH domain
MSTSPFNVVLAEARAAREMSVKELAARMGCTTGFVRSYEDCAINPTVRTLYLYAYALGMTVTISKSGVTIEDSEGGVVLRDWVPTLSEYRREARGEEAD